MGLAWFSHSRSRLPPVSERQKSLKTRCLAVVFGDQLDRHSGALQDLDPEQDAVLMMEVAEEATYIPQHRQRLVLFFSAMRHHAQDLRERGYRVFYSELDDPDNRGNFRDELSRWFERTGPEQVRAVLPGDYRVLSLLQDACQARDLVLELLPDHHFIDTPEAFEQWAGERKLLRLEDYYRQMRKQHDLLMEDGQPAGGQWNYDTDNRESFRAGKVPDIKAPRSFRPDDITREVMDLVAREFPDAPGQLDGFDYPVTHEQALAALRDFIQHRLPHFGTYQDAMARGRPYLYHSRLSCVLNLHLLDPRKAIQSAIEAWRADHAPLNAVEGFVRQILGWREFIRGVYWWRMPAYAELNELEAEQPMPALFWTGDTDMACVRDAVGQLQDTAYAHHIQRLMVLGLLAQLIGVKPYEVHRWHMSLYADAVDWVSLPNVLGMSQFGDGGIVGSKPYCASGNYINRMSNHCGDCRYQPGEAVGEAACPFTTLYWDFLSRHRRRLSNNRRMHFQYLNLDKKSDADRRAIRQRARKLIKDFTRETWL